MLTRIVGLLLAMMIATVPAITVSVLPASADHTDDHEPAHCVTYDEFGNCLIKVTGSTNNPQPHTPGEPTNTGGGGGYVCMSDGSTALPEGVVPCHSDWDGGYWSNSAQCYISLADPQPAATDPVWGAHSPGEGAIYFCSVSAFSIASMWFANPPEGPATGPTPVSVAYTAIASMNFKAIQIGITPEPGPNKLGIVGMPTWMWVADPGPNTTGPITATASAGPIRVTATATLDRIVWDMGDGTTVTCEGARAKGTPYSDGYGRQDSPTCGHRYSKTSGDKPDNLYTVIAESYWVVNWAGAGQSGTITLAPFRRQTQIRVGEMQVLEQ